MKRPGLTALLALLLAAALVYGIAQLFALRLEHGDVYPPYSTLRTDPRGAKAFYDALGELPGFDVRRNFRPLIRLQPAKPVTLIYAGVKRQSKWGEEEFRELQSLVASGTRVVFAFAPEEPVSPGDESAGSGGKKDSVPLEGNDESKSPTADQKEADEKPGGGDGQKSDEEKKKDKKKEEAEKEHTLAFSAVAERLGFKFKRLAENETKDDPLGARPAGPGLRFEPEITWHSAAYFAELKPGWNTLYARDGRVFVAERAFGSGSIVIASDSYFLSNEALRNERSPRLLAYLAGPAREIVFDEEHHGVTEEANIATLARKYRLHGLVVGALLAAALFIWQSSAPFLPEPASRLPDPGIVRGKSAEEGFINLLRRAVKPSELLAICATEWKKAFDPEGRTPKAVHLEKVLASERDPVAACQTISQVLSQKK